ncbi:hypothetical protein FZC66_14995 [Priestia megaterium]|nr:hypothetical protein FZC66_14995 [Priestia megaterium]
MFKKEEVITVHGIKFYGVMNKKQKAILKEVEKVTDSIDWQGIKGVYCLGSVKVQGRDVLGVYFGQFNEKLSSKQKRLQFEINYVKYTVTECPIVFIDTIKNKKPHQFAFIVLHELGHHVDRMQNGATLREGNEQQELFANTYALEKFVKMEGMHSKRLKDIPFLKEAINQFEHSSHSLGALKLQVE